MSRSIHRTRRDYWEELEQSYVDAESKAERLEEIKQSLRRKRTIKREMRRERRAIAPESHVSPDTIPIEVRDASKFVHFPASVQDLHAVMHRLPAGYVDGLGLIALSLGREFQNDEFQEWESFEPDPYTGRIGCEILLGVFGPSILGHYVRDASNSTVRIYAFVYDRQQVAQLDMWELFLRLSMLSTFVHELAHHEDYSRRTARGRWLGFNSNRNEEFAEHDQYALVEECVLPYLREAYPEAVGLLEQWILDHVGIELPLALLSSDFLRLDRKLANWRMAFGSVLPAFQQFVTSMQKEQPLAEARIELARDLYMSKHYDYSLDILDVVLQQPSNEAGLSLKAEIYADIERIDEAEAIAKDLVARNSNCVAAWRILAEICEERCDWSGVRAAATGGLHCTPLADWPRSVFLEYRIVACFATKDFACADSDIAEMSGLPAPGYQATAAVLNALSMLCRNDFATAGACASAANQSSSLLRHHSSILAAIQYEVRTHHTSDACSSKLNSAGLTWRAVRLMRNCGFEWSDEVREIYGLDRT